MLARTPKRAIAAAPESRTIRSVLLSREQQNKNPSTFSPNLIRAAALDDDNSWRTIIPGGIHDADGYSQRRSNALSARSPFENRLTPRARANTHTHAYARPHMKHIYTTRNINRQR